MVYMRFLLLPTLSAISGIAAPVGFDALRDAMGHGVSEVWESSRVPAIDAPPPEPVPEPESEPDTQDAPAGRGLHKPVEFHRAADGLFYVHAAVNGTRIRFVLDTGSSVMILARRDAQALGLDPGRGGYGAKVQTANGDAAMAWTTLRQVRVGDRHVRNLRAAIVRNGPGTSLMGQNMLSELGSVTIAGDRLTLR